MARIAADGKPSSAGHWRREWLVAGSIDFNEGEGQAVREYTTDSSPADYVLFLDRKPVGVRETKMHQLFGDQMDDLIEQLNGDLVA